MIDIIPIFILITWFLDLIHGIFKIFIHIYLGIFLSSLPYTIFIIAVIGWFLAVLQTVFAAPLWAVMHMTPDRTFVGSQTQGYLMFLSLFMRPVLIIAALFAAMLLANPIILYVSKAFWAMRTANVSSAESIGFYVQFLTWKNWLIMYGMILLPVVYMIYGLTNTLPDAILTWIGAGIKPLGETQATAEMRGGMERHGVGGEKLLPQGVLAPGVVRRRADCQPQAPAAAAVVGVVLFLAPARRQITDFSPTRAKLASTSSRIMCLKKPKPKAKVAALPPRQVFGMRRFRHHLATLPKRTVTMTLDTCRKIPITVR